MQHRIEHLEDRVQHYGYKIPNGEHKVDFSTTREPFAIDDDTRFLTFSVINSASTNVNFSFYTEPLNDASRKSEATITLKPGQSVVKIDLSSLLVSVRGTTSLAVTELYSLVGITDSAYMGVIFGYTSNNSLTGETTVYEWK